MTAGPGSGLRARLRVRLVDVELDLAAGETVALLGPNGAGKSTVLRALAGLLPSGGEISVGGVRIEGLAPEYRRIGLVFQDYLLFPHLSAVDNVAFGPRCAGVSKARARQVATEWLGRVGLGGHLRSRPGRLSGGQAQRVALARALATEPRLLLLDEPLAALDVRSRLEIRAELRRHLAEFPGAALLVTHDPLDAMTLADRILILEDGRITQEGTPVEITSRPRTEYVATLVGLNLYRGVARDGVVAELAPVGGGTRADEHVPGPPPGPAPAGGRPVTLTAGEAGTGDVFVAFPPSAVALFRDRPDGSPRNVWPGRVAAVDQHGDKVRVRLDGELPVAADVTPAALAALELAPGALVWAAVKATETHIYPA
ncbi:ABC transporter ATP-binding protein [Longispora fulva]|uniref:Molybdate transport system ATP-binding protein n=1 Tax=Longispora fulva TaxID=619741 RepID=A0A8J7H0F7_9ACTN|nr:ATP-binding cassette domain-containing protein [Longispora fulva]MBG6141856.1 molybdate transport system ATP-binding protein [Longispora fulva]GIG58988.1 ABC transporter ATP-binding protein [Longispora fulva]